MVITDAKIGDFIPVQMTRQEAYGALMAYVQTENMWGLIDAYGPCCYAMEGISPTCAKCDCKREVLLFSFSVSAREKEAEWFRGLQSRAGGGFLQLVSRVCFNLQSAASLLIFNSLRAQNVLIMLSGSQPQAAPAF